VTKQTRRSLSISGELYDALKRAADLVHEGQSTVAERLLRQALGMKPRQELKDPQPEESPKKVEKAPAKPKEPVRKVKAPEVAPEPAKKPVVEEKPANGKNGKSYGYVSPPPAPDTRGEGNTKFF
jgi:outer membrane biosynthesis protein TonB